MELGAIKTTRALTDPVIVHQPTREWALPSDHRIYDDITHARIKQNIDTELDERIEYATWPETVAYLSTASMDSRYAGRELRDAYQHAFREYLDRWTSLDPDEQPPPLNENPELDEYHMDQLDTLRFGIKKDRDIHFVDEQYEDLDVEGVPKSFWTTQYERSQQTSDLDEYSQSALGDFE